MGENLDGCNVFDNNIDVQEILDLQLPEYIYKRRGGLKKTFMNTFSQNSDPQTDE